MSLNQVILIQFRNEIQADATRLNQGQMLFNTFVCVRIGRAAGAPRRLLNRPPVFRPHSPPMFSRENYVTLASTSGRLFLLSFYLCGQTSKAINFSQAAGR